MKTVIMPELYSLLWPEGFEKKASSWSGATNPYFITDLNLEELAESLSFDRLHLVTVERLLQLITDEPDVINYRLDIMEDLLAYPDLAAGLENILPLLDNLETNLVNTPTTVADYPFLQTVSRLGELEVYTDCICKLQACLTSVTLKSKGLSRLQRVINGVADNPDFKELVAQLPKLRSGFTRLASITIGINLDEEVHPYQATLLSINDRKFKGGSLLNRFLNKNNNDSPYQGISPLMKIEMIQAWNNDALQYVPNPLHQAIFNELNRIVGYVAKPVAAELHQYTKFNSRLLVTIKPEIAFLLGAIKLITKIRAAGLPLCRPVIADKEARIFKVGDLYNLNFAFSLSLKQPGVKQAVVTNEVDFDENSRIFILTGPNRGGKTVYTQGIGLVQILGQLGIWVPGREALLSPVDAIYTHFPVTEKPDSNLGRLGEESQRLSEIFQRATKFSLILLNESLSSTSPGECLYLSREIVIGLKLLGARTVFATHLHELAANLKEMNAQIPGNDKVISMVAGVITTDGSQTESVSFTQRTFKITPGPPQGLSYARDIATRYGISREKLILAMQERAVIDRNPILNWMNIDELEIVE